MSSWHSKIVLEPDNLDHILDACTYFDDQYEIGRNELVLKGNRIEDISMRLPGLIGWRFAQLQELEAIISLLEIREGRLKTEKRKHFSEHYNRTLTENTAKNYAENDPMVCAFAELRNQVAFVRNKYLALTKQYETLHFQLGYIVKLRVAGIEDATL